MVEKDLSIVALVGDHEKAIPALAANVWALGKNGVNAGHCGDERNISAVINTVDVRRRSMFYMKIF